MFSGKKHLKTARGPRNFAEVKLVTASERHTSPQWCLLQLWLQTVFLLYSTALQQVCHLFEAVVKGTVPLISFSLCLSFVCRKATASCLLMLYAAPLDECCQSCLYMYPTPLFKGTYCNCFCIQIVTYLEWGYIHFYTLTVCKLKTLEN